MSPDPHPRLAAIQTELTEVRRQLAARAHSGLDEQDRSTAPVLLRFLGGMALAAAPALLLLLAALAVVDGEIAIALFFLLPGLGLGYLAYRIAAPALRAILEGNHGRQALLAREQALLREAAHLAGGGAAAGPPAWGAGPLPAPPDRQPSSYAQMMHVRFPLGRSPERALRELPADAPAWKVAFHRSIGWGTVAPFAGLLVAVTVVVLVNALA